MTGMISTRLAQLLQLSVIASQQMTAENQARREAYHAEVLVADETAFSYNTGWRRNGWASAHGETRAVDIQPKIYAPSHSVGCIPALLFCLDATSRLAAQDGADELFFVAFRWPWTGR